MRSIWAVAVNTVKQAVRMKVAAVFIILLVVLLPTLGLTMTGDGTLKGRLQTFVSYGLSLTALLLCLLTIVVSIYSVSSDFQQKQIFTVLIKPIRRFEFLLGKMLGVILLDTCLLVLFAGMIYAITLYMPSFFDANEEQRRQAQDEFFTARTALKPPQVDVTEEVNQAYDKLKKTEQLRQLLEKTKEREIRAELSTQKQLEKRAVVPGRELVWEFENVRPLDANDTLFIKFKYDVAVNPPDLKVGGKWLIGDIRQYGGKMKTPVYPFDRIDLIRTFREIHVPADAVALDGYLAVAFFNDPHLNNTVVIFPLEDGLEVLYKADSFTANFLRAVLMILCRLVFLASLGILASTFLSFPVALLLCLLIFFTGTVSGFVLESFDYLNENVGKLYSFTVRPLVQLLPHFDKANPTKFLVPARLLSWSLLAEVVGFMVCIKALVLTLVAVFIFSRREIAKITV